MDFRSPSLLLINKCPSIRTSLQWRTTVEDIIKESRQPVNNPLESIAKSPYNAPSLADSDIDTLRGAVAQLGERMSGRHDSLFASADNKAVTKDGISACTNACTGEAETGAENALNDLAAKVNSLSESDRLRLLRLLGEDSR
jgi:hypothetical protein